jgi:hypothetical protein
MVEPPELTAFDKRRRDFATILEGSPDSLPFAETSVRTPGIGLLKTQRSTLYRDTRARNRAVYFYGND